MKIVCNKKIIENRIKIAKKIIDNKCNIKDLKCIKLTATKDNLKLECANNNLGLHVIEIKLECEVIKKGSCLIDFKTFENAVKNCDGDFIEIELNECYLYVNGNNFKSKNQILNDGTFTYSIDLEYKKIISLDFEDMKAALKKVSSAISKAKINTALNCYMLDVENNYMHLTSCDGYRVATNKVLCKNDDKKNYLLPGRILNLISSIKYNNDVEIFESKRYIKIAIDNINLYINILEGESIQYKKLIRNDYSTKVQINDSKKLHDMLKGFKDAVKNYKNKEIILNIKDDKICIQDKDKTIYNEYKIDNKIGEDLIIAFNLDYLLDGLKNIKGDTEMTFKTNVNPILIKNINYAYLLLPVRVMNIHDKVA